MLRDKEMLKNFRSLPLLYEKAFCKTKEKYDMTQFEVDVLGFVYFYPEYESLAELCKKTGISYREAYEIAVNEAKKEV